MRRIVGNADFQPEAVGHTFQVILEHVAIGGVAAAAIAEQQHAFRLGKSGIAMPFPPHAEAVACESTGVVAETQIQVAQVAFDVVETVRIDHAPCGTGKIVVQSFLGSLRVQPALAKQQAEEFLVFGIHAHDGIGRLHEIGTVARDDLELPIPMDMASQRQRFAGLATPQAMALQKLRHDGNAHAKASPQQFLGNLGTRKVGPQNAVSVGIAGGMGIDNGQKGLVEAWKKRQTALPATPFFRACCGGMSEPGCCNSFSPRSMGKRSPDQVGVISTIIGYEINAKIGIGKSAHANRAKENSLQRT